MSSIPTGRRLSAADMTATHPDDCDGAPMFIPLRGGVATPATIEGVCLVCGWTRSVNVLSPRRGRMWRLGERLGVAWLQRRAER